MKFSDGHQINCEPKNIYIISIFTFFLIWYLLIVINYLKGLWDATPDAKTPDPKINIKSKNQDIILKHINYDNCPACGMKLKTSDQECPDCGLCLK